MTVKPAATTCLAASKLSTPKTPRTSPTAAKAKSVSPASRKSSPTSTWKKRCNRAARDTAREVLLDALRLDIQNIARTARTARAIAQDEPGFADNFRTPDSASQADLITTADACILRLADQPADTAAQKTAKTALRAKFIAHELPADFAQNLVDDRAAIDRSDDEGEGDDQEGVASTAAVGRLIRAGMKEVNYLDAIMHNKYARNADKFRAWQSASHIERAPKREKKPTLGDGTNPPAK